MAELQPDGTLLVRAALDGGLTLCGELHQFDGIRKVQSIETRPLTSQTGVARDLPPAQFGSQPTVADRRKSAAARQQMLQERLQQVQKENPAFSFRQAWQQLQQKEPGLFDGMTVVTHPD